MTKLIIGITGLPASGKDTAANYLRARGFKHISLSQIIRSEARRRKIKITRAGLIKLGNFLRKELGPAVLAQKAVEKTANLDKVVVTSIRNLPEVDHLRKSGRFVLLKLTADPEIRLKRLRRRGRGDEKTLTIGQMFQREQQEQSDDPAALQLHKVLEQAEQVISDNGTKKELYQKLEALLSQLR